jgi:hypothetical protein
VIMDRVSVQVQTLTEAATALEAQTCDCGCRRGAEFLRHRAAELQAAGPRRLADSTVQRADRITAYVLTPGRDLYCRRCAPSPRGDIWTPVTSEELDEGGVCTACGVDVLID